METVKGSCLRVVFPTLTSLGESRVKCPWTWLGSRDTLIDAYPIAHWQVEMIPKGVWGVVNKGKAMARKKATHVNMIKGNFVNLPGGTSGKDSPCQCRRHKRCGFDPCVRMSPWRRVW